MQASANRVIISGWFPVVASRPDLQQAREFAVSLADKGDQYPVHAYGGSDDKGRTVFAVTLGGYLFRSEAQARVEFAKRNGIAADASLTQHDRWGQNLLE